MEVARHVPMFRRTRFFQLQEEGVKTYNADSSDTWVAIYIKRQQPFCIPLIFPLNQLKIYKVTGMTDKLKLADAVEWK